MWALASSPSPHLWPGMSYVEVSSQFKGRCYVRFGLAYHVIRSAHVGPDGDEPTTAVGNCFSLVRPFRDSARSAGAGLFGWVPFGQVHRRGAEVVLGQASAAKDTIHGWYQHSIKKTGILAQASYCT